MTKKQTNISFYMDTFRRQPKFSMTEEPLWDPGQDWIQIFDNLLKHPQELKLCHKQDPEDQDWSPGSGLVVASFKYPHFRGSRKVVSVTCVDSLHQQQVMVSIAYNI